MDKTEKKLSYYPSGKLRSERYLKQGVPHGQYRDWHENGVVASEGQYRNGLPEGKCQQWDEEGNLIASYEIKNGTGIQKTWLPKPQQWIEISWVNGMKNGRQRSSLKDGTILGDIYWINDQPVRKAKYFEECNINMELPHYDDDEEISKAKYKEKCKENERSSRDGDDDLINNILTSKDLHEALDWLTETNVPERSLGECKYNEESIAIIQSLYSVGAVKIWVFDIDGNPDEEQNSGRLIVELPDNPEKRAELLLKCVEIGDNKCFDPEPDTGQRYTLVMLD